MKEEGTSKWCIGIFVFVFVYGGEEYKKLGEWWMGSNEATHHFKGGVFVKGGISN